MTAPVRRCEATKMTKAWYRDRCSRNATARVSGKSYCEQHAKIMVGMPPDGRLDSRDAPS